MGIRMLGFMSLLSIANVNCNMDRAPAETIYTNASIWTGASNAARAQAIAVSSGTKSASYPPVNWI